MIVISGGEIGKHGALRGPCSKMLVGSNPTPGSNFRRLRLVTLCYIAQVVRAPGRPEDVDSRTTIT